jgi:ubiquinone/menaquinone biosynthesis C-methylase UbiE
MSGWKKKRRVKRRYDLAAHLYDMRYAEEQTAKYEASLESLKTKRLGRVLDVGCGTGLLFAHIVNRAELVVGLDISKKTLLKAKQNTTSFPNVRLVQADCDWLPFKTEVFDHVFAVTLIQNVPKPVDTLNEIKLVTSKKAVVVVTGLKKIFQLKRFKKLLHDVGLNVEVIKDEDNLKCYVAICAKMNH